MKTAVTIFFLALVTATQTPLGQLLKLPVLVEHFARHKKETGLSLLDFLKEHYSRDHQDQDQQEDEKLPFKNVMISNVSVAVVPNLFKVDFPLAEVAEKKLVRPGAHSPQQHICNIFHPPRV